LVSQDIFAKADMEIGHSINLQNPLASEFEYMRRSLIPSLLMDLENNQGKVDMPIRIFELANIYHHNEDNPKGLPEERPILAFAIQGEDYRHAKGYLEALINKLNLKEIRFSSIEEEGGCWQTNQTTQIYFGDQFIGVFGAIKTTVKENFNLKGGVVIANLDFKTISKLANNNYSYLPISQYPDIVEDITIESNLKIGEIIQLIKEDSRLVVSANYKTSLANKHTFEIHLNHPEHNLTQEEANKIKESLLPRLKQLE
ncbi:hypothetical protein HYS10_01565, partial [Candidatus Collierbacteria bacterium]|nr:hypothetical protein [Candidatus Collierbacteria bacterium]